MARVISVAELKEMKNKTFFTNIGGRVVACRFKSLHVYISGRWRACDKQKYMQSRFDFLIERADGGVLYGIYNKLPRIYDTIDDCVADRNTYYMAVVNECDLLEPWLAEVQTIKILNQDWLQLCTWSRTTDMKVKLITFTSVRYDVFEGKLSFPYSPNKKVFKHKEDCLRECPIEVITFD